jgi:predicted O-methyltransferase YrrM
VLSRILRGVRKHGPLGSVRAVVDVLVVLPVQRRRRRAAKPSLKALVRATSSIEIRAEDLLARLGHTVPAELSAEADALLAELERRTEAARLLYPQRFAVEHESGRLLYLLARVLRPGLMVETGVANGASTFLVLTAMERNGSGRLVSIDISADVGSLLTDEERRLPHWDLRVIRPGDIATGLAGLEAIDVFFHDSDHSHANVTAELEAAWPRMAPGGLVLGDDGELSFAFVDVAATHGVKPVGLFDRRKLFMVAVA